MSGSQFNSHFSFFLFLKSRLVLFALSLMLAMLHHQAAVCSCFSSASLVHVCPSLSLSLSHSWLSSRSYFIGVKLEKLSLPFSIHKVLFSHRYLASKRVLHNSQESTHYWVFHWFTHRIYVEFGKQLTEVNQVPSNRWTTLEFTLNKQDKLHWSLSSISCHNLTSCFRYILCEKKINR